MLCIVCVSVEEEAHEEVEEEAPKDETTIQVGARIETRGTFLLMVDHFHDLEGCPRPGDHEIWS